MRKYVSLLPVIVAIAAFNDPSIVYPAAPKSLILNEANAVSGSKFLSGGNSDTALGRLEGNGQNWLEFLVVQGDELDEGGYSNTLDLRGWTVEWSYNKDNLGVNKGDGVIEFTNDPLWGSVPRGTLITISEWQDAWYLTDTPASYDPVINGGGLKREGGINGLGHRRGVDFDPDIHTKIPNGALFTDVGWNPGTSSGGIDGDWRIHVFAGELDEDDQFKYFNFSGTVKEGAATYPVGVAIPSDTSKESLFTANNDNWQFTIKDKPVDEQTPANVIQGPIGEEDTGLGSTWRVGSDELVRLEAFHQGTNPTQAQYLGVGIANYQDGSSSTFGTANVWSQGAGQQGLVGLRDWLHPGDANLAGIVDAADYVIWRHFDGGAGGWSEGDFNGDGDVDSNDYDAWQSHFGEGMGGGGAAVNSAAELSVAPEPTSLILLAFSVIGFMRRPRRGSRLGGCGRRQRPIRSDVTILNCGC